jgi:hypothetical protein
LTLNSISISQALHPHSLLLMSGTQDLSLQVIGYNRRTI